MATINLQKSGFVTMEALLDSVINDLTSNGFNIIYDSRPTASEGSKMGTLIYREGEVQSVPAGSYIVGDVSGSTAYITNYTVVFDTQYYGLYGHIYVENASGDFLSENATIYTDDTMTTVVTTVFTYASSLYELPPDPKKVTLEAGPDVDPLYDSQPWRMQIWTNYNLPLTKSVSGDGGDVSTFSIKNILGRMIFGTPIQLDDEGGYAVLPNPITDPTDPRSKEPDTVSGEIAYGLFQSSMINKARPCSYTLTITNRGIALSVTTDAEDEGRGIFWMCCQRLVNAVTGDILLDGHSPVMCNYFVEEIPRVVVEGNSEDGFSVKYEPFSPTFDNKEINTRVYQMVVREEDVHAPAIPTLVDSYQNYSGKNINIEKQLSISNHDKYVLTVPDGMNTHRHLYHNDRMDMITYISANIIPEKINARINMHGEATVVFVNGTSDFGVGTILIGADTESRAVIYRIELSSGDWSTNNAAGVIYVKQLSGSFKNENIVSEDENGVQYGSGEAIVTDLTYRTYTAQRCSGGDVKVEDGYTEGSRVLFLTENGDI